MLNAFTLVSHGSVLYTGYVVIFFARDFSNLKQILVSDHVVGV